MDHLLALVWLDGYRTIGHTYIARELGIASDLAADLLLEAAGLGIVAAKFDLRCPHCGHVVAVSTIRDVPVSDQECPSCWEAFTPGQDDLFVSFEVACAPEGDVGGKKLKGGGACPPPPTDAVSFGGLAEVSLYFRESFAPGNLFQLPSLDDYRLLLERCFTQWQATKKGAALEDLAKYLLDSVAAFRFMERNYDTLIGEIDLLYSVLPIYPFHDWRKWLLVECKNWNERVDAGEIDKFAGKMKTAGAQVGILIAPQGVTGPKGQNAEGNIASLWQRERIQVLVLTRDDLEAVRDGSNLCVILERRELEVCFPPK